MVGKSLVQRMHKLGVDTRGSGLTDVSRQVGDWLQQIGAGEGLLNLFIQHTSASLTIQENADPDVLADLLDAMAHLAPESDVYRHNSEGPDDMPAHIKSALTSTSLSVPVTAGEMMLGTWQGIYLWEHRSRPHQRNIVLHFAGTLLETPAE